jgi:hypothetical protein
VTRDRAARLDFAEEIAVAGRVVAEDIERVLAGVEATLAGLHRTIVLEGLANLELVATAAHLCIEALVRRDHRSGGRLGYCLRDGSLGRNVIRFLFRHLTLPLHLCSRAEPRSAPVLERGR